MVRENSVWHLSVLRFPGRFTGEVEARSVMQADYQIEGLLVVTEASGRKQRRVEHSLGIVEKQ